MLQIVETPRANPEQLLTLVQGAYDGKVVLPEFQRSFVWSREAIEELLVSMLQGYFIGTFLVLDTQSERSLFPYRTVEGLDKINPHVNPENHSTVRLILDGQQRLTAIFYALHEPPINLRYTSYPYKFFFRVDLALDEDPSDAVLAISIADRGRLGEMNELMAEHRAIPFSTLASSDKFYQWFYNEQQFLQSERDRQVVKTFRERFQQFMVPVVSLSSETGTANIINIFERINRTGVTLSLFDLAVARLYKKDVKLRKHWDEFCRENEEVAQVIQPDASLKVIALLQGKETKRTSLLDTVDALDKEQFKRQWAVATRYLASAYKRMTAAHGGYGAFKPNWIPYTTMLVPLAAFLQSIETLHGGEEMYRKLDQWYWTSVFFSRFDHAVDSQTFSDVKDVIRWFQGEDAPTWIQATDPEKVNPDVYESRSALYRGLMCLVVLRGAKDFCTGQMVPLNECQDDHIFPKSKYKTHKRVNSLLNRTLIFGNCNKRKTDKLPSEFLPMFLESHGGDAQRLRETLLSHFIPDEARETLERDDLDAFMLAREKEFVADIKRRIGKAV